ncbi:MAG: hypothetical protein JST30_07425 [Armatimonadetes bacterium]|nr:hypothetical protein [Armatimonadota bacterium]
MSSEKEQKGAGRVRKPDLGNLDGFIEKIVQVPKKEMDEIEATRPKRRSRKKQ